MKHNEMKWASVKWHSHNVHSTASYRFEHALLFLVGATAAEEANDEHQATDHHQQDEHRRERVTEEADVRVQTRVYDRASDDQPQAG